MSVTWLPQQFSQVAWHTRHRAGPQVSYTSVGLLQERCKSDSLLCSGICGLLSLRPARACMQGTQFSYLHKVPRLSKQLPKLTARAHLGRVMASALRNETPEQRAARKEQIKAQKADKRARREGHVPHEYGQKQCSLCNQLKDLLIRRGSVV